MEQTPKALAVYAISALTVTWIVRSIIYHFTTESKIRRSGGHAPSVPSYLPLGIGFVVEVFRKNNKHELLDLWQSLLRKYANPNHPTTVEVSPGGQRSIITIDELNIKAILATQFADYGKGEVFHRDWREFLGDSIFTTDGTLWHQSRQLIRPQFIKDRVSDLHVFENHINVLLPILAGGAHSRPGTPVDLVDIFYRYTLDAATDFLLGTSVHSLEMSEVPFADAFARVQHTQGLISRIGPMSAFVPRKKFREELKIVDAFIEQFVESTLRLSPDELEKNSKSDEGYTFLHALAGFTRDPQVLRDQIAAVLLAGRDTTAMTLAWTFYEISCRPQIVEKLRMEITATLPDGSAPTYADLKNMKYLTHTINETLRLYPIVPYNTRVAIKDTTLPRGGGSDGMQPIGVPKGTPIFYSPLGMQRRADIYPPVSETFAHHLEFSPERWDHWHPQMWTYIPFNGGPRICIGQQYALTEVAYTTVRILQTYSRLENCMPGPPGLQSDIVLQPSTPVDVAFFR
ncbi:hypothetical protein AAFC00_001128 [Neodothiora populina]|uniref:Cytochrome P450 alkane hydroxylase n=1 Tax=Neodothiora populina TaxID=2781224 RepID=A0ABR3PN64_9PEZI